MNSARLVLAERQVPRYTSYPTAPHFHPGIGPREYADWLAALPAEATLSLYLHVPFCQAMCAYCGCHTKVVRRPEPIEAYLAALLAEIELVSDATAARRVTHLHWGGGTPTMLGLPGMAQVMEALARRFDLSALAEHAIELDPRAMTEETARGLAGLGTNRASLGVQDFNAAVQRAIGRIQPYDVVAAAVEHLRRHGIRSINLDLMYGLPLQDREGLLRSLELAHGLAPDRIALFGYAHVPWMKKHQRLIEEGTLPGPQARLMQAEAARSLLLGLGYMGVGLDHFARPEDELARAAREGRLRRNFQGYTTDAADALIGLGASAIGRLPQGFVQNRPDLRAYRAAIAAGRFATQRGKALSADDLLRGAIIERLMCDFAVEVDRAMLEEVRPRLAPLAEQGIVTLRGGRIVVTAEGRPFVRLVAAAFDAYLDQAGRHSAAV
ncbi:MAG: oxygen-independent coproporphyrinogen III oxidase [Rhodovarius sp.]|nr:oxygen-independent coproporphyrinogen III oxidase [Rhodovarius sp.]MDW8314636.1 oxygen-independent coproporphyrinogen III oxidase [Rhodovarius sp.]